MQALQAKAELDIFSFMKDHLEGGGILEAIIKEPEEGGGTLQSLPPSDRGDAD